MIEELRTSKIENFFIASMGCGCFTIPAATSVSCVVLPVLGTGADLLTAACPWVLALMICVLTGIYTSDLLASGPRPASVLDDDDLLAGETRLAWGPAKLEPSGANTKGQLHLTDQRLLFIPEAGSMTVWSRSDLEIHPRSRIRMVFNIDGQTVSLRVQRQRRWMKLLAGE